MELVEYSDFEWWEDYDKKQNKQIEKDRAGFSSEVSHWS